jgi:hypothetical protein
MIVFKSCPRCRGDLLLDMEEEITCLQCGYELRPAEKEPILVQVRPARRRRREPVAA